MTSNSDVTNFTIIVSGIQCEEGALNGRYERNGFFASSGKPQWMIPKSRTYVRFIRGRWEIYGTHHVTHAGADQAGTTYFYHPDLDALVPPESGWIPTLAALPSDSPLLASEPVRRKQGIFLWFNHTCPFAQRVRIALRELDLTGDICEKHVNIFGSKDGVVPTGAEIEANAEWRRLFEKACSDKRRHARPTVPLLEQWLDDGDPLLLLESSIIVEYLNEAFHSKCSDYASSLKIDPATRAKVRLFVDAFDRSLAKCESAILNATNQKALHEASDMLTEGFKAVEFALNAYGSNGSGPFLQGARFGLAEVLCAPMLQRLMTLCPRFRSSLPYRTTADLAKWSRLKEWVEAVLARKSVVDTFDLNAVIEVKQVASFVSGDPEEEMSLAEKRKSAVAALEARFRSSGSSGSQGTATGNAAGKGKGKKGKAPQLNINNSVVSKGKGKDKRRQKLHELHSTKETQATTV